MKLSHKILFLTLFVCILLSSCVQQAVLETTVPILEDTDELENAWPWLSPKGVLIPEGMTLDSAIVVYDNDTIGGYKKGENGLNELFEACGFGEGEPFYEYCNEQGQLQVALYFNQEMGKGVGIRYKYVEDNALILCGFGFEQIVNAEEDRSEIYWHHWDDNYQILDSVSDDMGRILYERRYVTHGSLDYYYIYEKDSVKATYCLWLDDNCGDYFSEFVYF